jgi:hypothetical protein
MFFALHLPAYSAQALRPQPMGVGKITRVLVISVGHELSEESAR